MILPALRIIKKELNQFLQLRLDVEATDLVDLSQLTNLDGSVVVPGSGKILITFFNAYQERMAAQPLMKQSNHVIPPVELGLELLLSAHYEPHAYEEALAALSEVIGYFRGKPVFLPENTPGLPPGMSKMTLELLNLDSRDMSQFRMATGIKLLPAVLYRVRVLTKDEDVNTAVRPVNQAIASDAEAKK